jgi:hypothetical protein
MADCVVPGIWWLHGTRGKLHLLTPHQQQQKALTQHADAVLRFPSQCDYRSA